MSVTQQHIESIKIEKLKNIQNLEMDFSESPLIAIMGVNGAGKSTILHALACCYKPDEVVRKDYKFSDFFLPNTYALWDDSKFEIKYSYRDGNKQYKDVKRNYQKQERWTPRYQGRPQRYVSYIGINSCVPDIESDNAKSFVTLTLNEQTDDTSVHILTDCKYVLNIPYTQLAICKNSSKKEYLGVLRENIGYCTSLSMGAGEQRVFKIISQAYRCPKYSLLLIDELDLLLHDNAIKRIIQKLNEICSARKLQIIFTTHSMLMNELSEYVKIRYLVQTSVATLVQTAISTDSILQLTGDMLRPIQIYVEDKLSQTIISQLCSELNCKRYVQIFLFGPATNSFTAIAGKVLNDNLDVKTIAVLDGDVYTTEDEKVARIKEIVTGQAYEPQRKQILQAIIQYHLPENQKPESFIRNSVISLPRNILSEQNEFRLVLDEIGVVDDDHKYVDDAIKRLAMDYQVGLSKIIELFAKSESWEDYISPVRNWLEAVLKTF